MLWHGGAKTAIFKVKFSWVGRYQGPKLNPSAGGGSTCFGTQCQLKKAPVNEQCGLSNRLLLTNPGERGVQNVNPKYLTLREMTLELQKMWGSRFSSMSEVFSATPLLRWSHPGGWRTDPNSFKKKLHFHLITKYPWKVDHPDFKV